MEFGKTREFIMVVTSTEGDDSAIFGIHPSPVMYRLNYTPPFEPPKFIREIQLSVRRYDVFERPPITIAIDATEYLGHEDEEYFTVLLKFLYDHRDRWNYIFVIRAGFDRKVREMFAALRTYMRGTLTVDRRWESIDELTRQIRLCRFDPEAARVFARVMLSDSFKGCRSVTFIENVASEVLEKSGGRVVTLPDLLSCAADSSSSLNIIGGDDIVSLIEVERKEKRHA